MYEFDGNWISKMSFESLKSFRNASGAYTGIVNRPNTGQVTLHIVDQLTNDPDPTPAQLNAINYLIDSEQYVFAKLLEHVLADYPRIREMYAGMDEEDMLRDCPPISEPDEMKKLIGVGNVFIHLEEVDGIANIGFECGCTWDEEHGHGIVMNREDLIRIGQADIAFSTKQEPAGYTVPAVPIKHKPHPKYGVLKPHQITENKWYASRLISGNHIEEFKRQVAEGEIDLHAKPEPNITPFMHTAILRSNFDFALWLKSQGVSFSGALHKVAARAFKEEAFEFLLEQGVNINQKDSSGRTLLQMRARQLVTCYDQQWQAIKYKKPENPFLLENIQLQKKMIRKFIALGANPYFKNQHKQDCFTMASHLQEEMKAEYHDFLRECCAESGVGPPSPKTRKPKNDFSPPSQSTKKQNKIEPPKAKPEAKKPNKDKPDPDKPWWKFW